MSVGRFWDEAKNMRVLDAIADRVEWPIKLAGDLANPIDGSHAVPMATEYLGRLSQPALARWLGHAAIYAHPSLYEPFGLSVLEAALSGCALVLGDLPSLRELWQDAALLVEPRDAEALAAALNALVADPDRVLSLGAAARERARRYGATNMIEGYCRAYGELLGGTAVERTTGVRGSLSDGTPPRDYAAT